MIAGTTLFAFCFWLLGCATTTKQTFIREELTESRDGRIVEMILDNGDVVRFDEIGGRFVSKGAGQEGKTMILGYTWDKRAVEIDAEKVLKVEVEKSETNAAETILLIILGVPALTLAFLVLYLLLVPIH